MNRSKDESISNGSNLPISTRILVTTDNVHDAKEIQDLLRGRFDQVRLSIDPNLLGRDFTDFRPDVLLFAFGNLEKAQKAYTRLERTDRSRHLHQTLILCDQTELQNAFDLCRTCDFDDYVLYWPYAQDARRLEMSIWNACRRLVGWRAQHTSSDLTVDPALTEGRFDARPLVMVVDDEEMARKLLSLTLDSTAYQIVFAHDAHSAMKQLQRQLPDVILMDIRLPGVDGLTLTAQLKASADTAGIPIIMVTGDARHATLRRCIRSGAVDFVVKPFTRLSLNNKVQKVIRQGVTASLVD